MKRKVVNLGFSLVVCIVLILIMIIPVGPFTDGLWVLQPWGGFFMLVAELDTQVLTQLFFQKFINVVGFPYSHSLCLS